MSGPAAGLALALALVALSGCGGGGSDAVRSPAEATPAPRAASARERAQADRRDQERAVRRFQILGRPIYCGGPRPYAALTFDDGPAPGTVRAARALARAGVRSTFFLMGAHVDLHPGAAREVVRLHGAAGDHTVTHPLLSRLRPAQVEAELAGGRRRIERHTGRRPQLFRPPFGVLTPAVRRTARRLGLLTVLWNLDSGDSLGATQRQVADDVLRRLRPGAIVLLHEGAPASRRALLQRILPNVHRRGLHLVTIPELLARNPPSPAALRRGIRGCPGGGELAHPNLPLTPPAR